MQTIFKPLIITSAYRLFWFATKKYNTGIAKWILFALFFSLAGDVLLMFQAKKEIFFLLGLSAFL